jgi:membrane protease YdiL (CAAX protease family)
VFNTVIGEELLFRGLLLPRMNGAFGRWDRTVNSRLFGASDIRQPWTIFGSSILGEFLFALPTKRFRSAWFGIFAHSGKSAYLLILILGLVLGFA